MRSNEVPALLCDCFPDSQGAIESAVLRRIKNKARDQNFGANLKGINDKNDEKDPVQGSRRPTCRNGFVEHGFGGFDDK
jgi:hypothetical protein